VRITGYASDVDHHRWRKLLDIARHLAERERRTALVVPHARDWLAQPRRGLREDEIVVTWSVVDAELIRHELRDYLPRDRVFAATPRVRRNTGGAGTAREIPDPRRPQRP
jgi:hypothetical protein